LGNTFFCVLTPSGGFGIPPGVCGFVPPGVAEGGFVFEKGDFGFIIRLLAFAKYSPSASNAVICILVPHH
jgi:hypothetical protein